MNLKEIEKVVGSLQSHLFKNSNSFSIGMLRSHFKGAGLQFKEHQVYAPGDDVRFIDWKLSAKTNTTFVKTFEEERNIEIYPVLDISETMFTGYKGVSKLQASIELICLLYLLAEKTKDKITTVIMGNEIKILPSMNGQGGIILFISQLEKLGLIHSNGKVNLNYEVEENKLEKKKLSLLKSFVARNREVVFLSDFNNIENMDVINKLIYRRNMHCFEMTSPLDESVEKPFSILGFNGRGKKFTKIFSTKSDELKGRYTKINVKDRYLEKFIREML